MRSTDRFPAYLRYDHHNSGPGMDLFLDGLNERGVRACVQDSVLFIDDTDMPYLSVVVKKDDAKGYGFLVDVPGYNLVTYWPRRDGSYNWDKIVERVKLARKIVDGSRAFRQRFRNGNEGKTP